MNKCIRKGRKPKKTATEIFREELSKDLSYVDLPKLASITGISYIRVWRLIKENYEFKADDLIKILVALNRLDVLQKICTALGNEMQEYAEQQKGA